MANFYKLNSDYITQFGNRVMDRYRENDKRSETSLFKSILEEVNNLFRKIGGRSVSKRDIPSNKDYPDSDVYNKLLNDIGFDIDKLYNAQKIIEADINNLMNFNSTQRARTFETFTTIQQEVYNAYIKAKRETIGGIEVPAGNPFTSADNMSPESEDVYIDETAKILTLAFDSSIQKNIDIRSTSIYFAGKLPDRPIYPLGDTMGVGSHWKTASNDPHFINTDNPGELDNYKAMMIDDPNNNMGVGFTEFEAVRTRTYGIPVVETRSEMRFYNNGGLVPIFMPLFSQPKATDSSIFTLKNYIGQRYGKDPVLIYLDITNSLQGSYVAQGIQILRKSEDSPKYKLVVPFTSNVLTNEITIDLSANDLSFIPEISWEESRVFSRVGGADVAYSLITPNDNENVVSIDGRYSCRIEKFIYPTRLELTLRYKSDADMWAPTDFYMSHYVYSADKTYEMPFYDGDSRLNMVIRKSYDVFVDTEANEVKEKERALNVLRDPNRSSK